MIRRRLVTTVLGASVWFAGGFFATSGCGGDAAQPDRGSISAPRKGGGVADIGGEKTKPKAAAGENAGAKDGAP
jgi:hypothetical protein